MKKNQNLVKYHGFKLISLFISDNPLLSNSSIEYSFMDKYEIEPNNYTTVIIGPNGTGKSNLFRIIIELFETLYFLKNEKSTKNNIKGIFKLIYSSKGQMFKFTNFNIQEDKTYGNKKYEYFLYKDNIQIEFNKAELPESIVASSILLNDKFPFPKKIKNEDGELFDSLPIYKYLGIKNRPQSASTKAIIRRTVEYIIDHFDATKERKGVVHAIKVAMEFLELTNPIVISYKLLNIPTFFSGKLTPEALDVFYEKIILQYKESNKIPPFKLSYYIKIKRDKALLTQVCNFCNKISSQISNNSIIKYTNEENKIYYDFINHDQYLELRQDYINLEHLRLLGMINPPEIELIRSGSYNLQESSSGEYHFLSSIIGLVAASKRSNNLILIDEPEISLHPNWQMKYISFLSKLFSHIDYTQSHILIATHSHFLISDLQGDSSKIIGLKRGRDKIEKVDLPKDIDTFGWSAEDVLYNIFNVRSSLNYYLQADLTELLGMMANNIKEPKKIRLILDKLNLLPKRDNDPLQNIIEEATEYLNTIL